MYLNSYLIVKFTSSLEFVVGLPRRKDDYIFLPSGFPGSLPLLLPFDIQIFDFCIAVLTISLFLDQQYPLGDTLVTQR